jgi:hypothetical protein
VKTTSAEEGSGFNIVRGIGDGVKDALWGLASGVGFSLKLATAVFGASWDEETFNELVQNIAQFPDQVSDLYEGWGNFTSYEKARTGTALILGLGMLVVDKKAPKITPEGITSRAARRDAMRQAGTPTTRPATFQSGGSGHRQLVVEGSDGMPRVQTQHPADKNHLKPHWHDSRPKVDENGIPRTNQHGQIKYCKDGCTTSEYGD